MLFYLEFVALSKQFQNVLPTHLNFIIRSIPWCGYHLAD